MSAKGTFIFLLLVDADRAAMMQAIDAFGADLKLEDVFKRARSSAAAATANAQIPWDNSSVFDDFYFRIPSAVPGAAHTRGGRRAVNTTFVSP
ncbi:MAG: hypothetical protein IT481_00885 [Gammaproteobacteria bacterium]|nr:hypothetical protein [Gammaproteobacteria bacterium]